MRLSSERLGCTLVLLFAGLATNFLGAQSRPLPQSPVQEPRMEWNRADHARTIPLRDMAPMAPKGERHEAPPFRLLPRAGKPIAPPPGVDTAMQSVAIAAP